MLQLPLVFLLLLLLHQLLLLMPKLRLLLRGLLLWRGLLRLGLWLELRLLHSQQMRPVLWHPVLLSLRQLLPPQLLNRSQFPLLNKSKISPKQIQKSSPYRVTSIPRWRDKTIPQGIWRTYWSWRRWRRNTLCPLLLPDHLAVRQPVGQLLVPHMIHFL